MKLKLGELRHVIEGLQVLIEKELYVKDQYWITKTLKKLSSEFKDCEESRVKVCEKYSEKDEDGNVITVKDDQGNDTYSMVDIDGFNKELGELWKMEIDVEFKPIPIERLENVKIDGVTMMKLEKFIKVD